MTYIKINEVLYPATVRGRVRDDEWNGRESKAITLNMTYEDAMAVFADDIYWYIVCKEGEKTEEYDNSDFCVAGSVTDNRDGTVTVKMGKITDKEALAELMEVLA